LISSVAAPTLGAVFLLAAFAKVTRPQEPLDAMRFLTGVVPVIAPDNAVRVLIMGEIIIGSFLIFKVWPKMTLTIAAVALGLFTLWILSLIATGSAVSCGCGLDATWLKPGQARWVALAKNVVLLSIAGFAMRACCSTRTIHSTVQVQNAQA